MRSFGRKRPQWPPSASVEDEAESLSRELHGLSMLGEKPGIEGVCARGTIDQYPVIQDVPFPLRPNAGQNDLDESGRENSSSEDSAGPATPPAVFIPDPLLRIVDGSRNIQSRPSLAPPLPVKEVPRGQPSKEHPQLTGSSRQRSRSRHPVPGVQNVNEMRSNHRTGPNQAPSTDSRSATGSARRVYAPVEKRTENIPPAVPRRSGSLRSGRPIGQSTAVPQRPISTAGYVSDSAAINPTKSNHSLREKPTPQTSKKATGGSSNGPTLAERLEEKLRLRQKLREAESSSQGGALPPDPLGPGQPTEPPKAHQGAAPPRSDSHPTSQSRSRASSSPKLIPRVSDTQNDSFSVATTGELTQPAARRTVSFLGGRQQGRERSRSSRRTSPSKELVRQPSPEVPSPRLLPCPRSVPMAGYQDWYTIKGLNHLDICPSCVKQMRNSRFCDLIIPAAPRPRGERVRCSLSEPWTRLAWVQTIKKQYETLDMLNQITRPRLGSKPCSGRIISDQSWYRIVDPETGMYLPKFNVCSACIRNLRTLMPQHRETFKRSTTIKERACDFVSDSPRFIQYIDLLDIAANRAHLEQSPRPDVTEFLAYTRRKVVLRDCRRDRRILGSWYYIPQLPEFTVCEDCYDDVVWPLVKAKKPIAREFSTMMRLVPGDKPSRCREASCQLYSPRIRAKFTDAVQQNDMAYLRLIALKRYDEEQHFRERQEELLLEEERGYDCDAELRRVLVEWRRWE